MSKFCFYHAECIDGFTAAWCFNRTGEYTCVALKYGEWEKTVRHVALEAHDEVLFVDVSIPPADANALAQRVKSVTVLDHHKTALESWGAAARRSNIDARFDLSKSGARLAWEYLHPGGEPVPMLVQYVEDRDLWRKELQASEEINAYIGAIPYTYPEYEQIYEALPRQFGDFVNHGAAILMAKQKVIDEALKKAEPFELLGVNVLAVNYGVTHGLSELGHELAKKSRDGCGLIWNIEKDHVRVSLRGHNGRDVSIMAQHFGGGGHPGAAGFRIPLARWLAEYNPLTRKFLNG